MAAWWRDVVAEWELDSHHEHLLTLAAEAWDRSEMARRQVEADGMTVVGRFGPKAHPAIAIERDAKLVFSRLVRQLNLDVSPAMPAGARRRG
jgi:phage terminase small subunit